MISKRIEQYDQAVRDTPPERRDPSLPVEDAAGKQFAEFLGMKDDAFLVVAGVSIFVAAHDLVKQLIDNVEIVSS